MTATATNDGQVGILGSSVVPTAGFDLLTRLYRDDEMERIFSEDTLIERWLQVEVALARAQGAAGVLTAAESEAIERAATVANIDRERLWRESSTVGYPILAIVRMIDEAIAPPLRGRVHLGATTQDIMDSALALQMRDAIDRMEELVASFGDAIAVHVEQHRDTVMPGRTHAQHAVPTTFGAKLSAYLGELDRHRCRLGELRQRVCVVSLYGAAGTSAALGPFAATIRRDVARTLGLRDAEVPWHVARDAIAEFGLVCALVAATCARLGREVVDLSRTEVGEVRETGGYHRGASSTMPQKANPISSEALIGIGAAVGGLLPTFTRVMEAGHERAAGEWQAEWFAVPSAARLTAATLKEAAALMKGLRVFPDAMRSNLDADFGLIMAEAYMIELARVLGRETAHDVVYAASELSRSQCLHLTDALRKVVPEELRGWLDGIVPIRPERYLGLAGAVCDAALAGWFGRRRVASGARADAVTG